MNWYTKFKTSGYSNELGYLKNYLKQGFDPYDFAHYLKDFLETLDPDEVNLPEGWENEEGYDLIEDWMKTATPQNKEQFKEYVGNHMSDDQASLPAYTTMQFNSLAKPQWLVHFTKNASSIKSSGFIYGHEEFEGLHLTTWKGDNQRYRNPGFNFAFQTGTRNASFAAYKEKYGKECVVFWGAAVEVWHSGDEERQMIFWGPSINRNMIFPIVKNYDEWCVPSETKDCIKKGSFEDCCTWIENNWRMLQQIEQKNKNITRERALLRMQRLQREKAALAS